MTRHSAPVDASSLDRLLALERDLRQRLEAAAEEAARLGAAVEEERASYERRFAAELAEAERRLRDALTAERGAQVIAARTAAEAEALRWSSVGAERIEALAGMILDRLSVEEGP